MTMKTTHLSHRHLPPFAELSSLADLQVRTGQHDLVPAPLSDAALASAERDEVASLVIALLALLGITLAVILLGAPPTPSVPSHQTLRAAPAGLAVPAATTAAPHGAPARLSLHGR